MDWTRGKTIGRGSTATVSVATDDHYGHVFAVKSSELSRSEFLRKEQGILSTLSCPQIVAYKGYDISLENGELFYNLFMEYSPNGTVTDAIINRGGCLDESTVRLYTREILLGLKFLHSNGIVHCDIKGRNILLTDDGVKIADLGCAKRADGVPTVAGTPVYMAPEVARGEQQGFAADVWALGCTVIEMVTGRAPWPDVGYHDPLSALYRIGFSCALPEIPSNISKQAKDFLSKCFKRDPTERWTAIELLAHDFVNESKFAVKQTSHGSQLETPTSVLCKKLWDTMDEFEKPCLPTKCMMKRIQLLVEDDLDLSLKMPKWDWDENWVTVRSNYRNNVDETTTGGCGDIRHDYDVGVDNYNLSEISGQNTSSSSSIIVETWCKISSLMACKYVACMILCIKLNYSNNRYSFNAFLLKQSKLYVFSR